MAATFLMKKWDSYHDIFEITNSSQYFSVPHWQESYYASQKK